MANSLSSSSRTAISFLSLVFLIVLVFAASLSSIASAYQLGGVRGWGRKVGGWTDIPDAASNLEVRDIGRYSVDEYNRRLRGRGEAPITFSSVLNGRRQVVSGIKYHLRVAAVGSHGIDHLTFDAVLITHPSIPERSRDLLSFTRSDD
ncbi:hypothetical protein IEQ34_000544 [Dendrobium chrysotoxum]|uniref:Cystatin domain-containing protein n=1 Tax=Dendrobium chrysotoxum TaxID=161865 RepID=A0AAV7HNU7_DENCH|nr:hypothetical protein IEQ34_000544 [Dendrobium chrysotoxum]